ncbi:ATP-binding protein [Halomarina rubra]|uniref:ATP-binding protein n=1 Tax=Halomarina rubra TaxID=2071873 RepID=A0ABD6AZX0_9EURY|nr:hypothetical protein [Halomarina rubra]
MVTAAPVMQALDSLATLLEVATKTGLRHTIRGTAQIPEFEWLLVSDGRADTQIRYLAGISVPDLTDDLLGILRTCFPNNYEFQEVDWHPRYIEECLPVENPSTGAQTMTFETGQTIETTLEPYVAGVEYHGRTTRGRDWQTPFATFAESVDGPSYRRREQYERTAPQRIPLATLIEAIRDADVPIVYQVVGGLHHDWSGEAGAYVADMEEGDVTISDYIRDIIFPRTYEDRKEHTPRRTDQRRIDAIGTRDSQRTFCVSMRAVALTRDNQQHADQIARRLSTALGSLDGPYHKLHGEVVTDADLRPLNDDPPGLALFNEIIDRTVHEPSYGGWRGYSPAHYSESNGIVVGRSELPGFFLVDGAGLTPNGKRALAIRPAERTGITLPPPQQLANYTPPGMALCMPLTHDRQPYGRPFYLRPSQQDRHLVVVGDTGAGKSVLTMGAALTNAMATEGLDIIFDHKGGGTAEEYLRIHYAAHGNLENVLHFDFSRVLPAFSFFNIESLIDAGISREEARSRKAGHYEEILQGILGAEKYGEAAESVKAIRNHLRALYDPVNGSDAVSHDDLYQALQRTQRLEALPATSDEKLGAYFDGLIERDPEILNKILSGAVGRVETIATDDRLAPLFNHVPREDIDTDLSTNDADGETPHFDFTELLNEDTVVIFDFAGMESTIKRTLTLVILSNLWTALKARKERARQEGRDDLPLVNLYLEEARQVGGTNLLDTLLSEGRSFGLSMLLGVQFLEQLDSSNPEDNTYQEALNETATFVVGNVTVDSDLPRVFANESMSREEVDQRLTAMRRGEWLVRPGTDFGQETVQPFLAWSLPPAPGHPASEQPITASEERDFEKAFEQVVFETARTAGLPYGEGSLFRSASESERDTTDADELADESDESEEPPQTQPTTRIDTLLAHTRRLPDAVTYDDAAHALCCASCSNRYDPSIDGMERAIECCHSMDDVDADDIPICEFNLKLTSDEIAASEWSLKQLLFIQAVYNVAQRRYDSREYDLLYDSMIRLIEYVDIDTDELEALVDAGLVRHDTDHPHRMYSVSSEGRSIIGESYRQGLDYGHGKGDLEESTEHVFGVILGMRLLDQMAADSDSDVVTVEPYYELGEGILPADAFMGGSEDAEDAASKYEQRRLDVAGLDEDGNIVATVEVERVNNDLRRAAPADFDKIADCEPEEAIWIVMNRKDAHEVLQALNDPLEGEPRVEKTYSVNTPSHQFNINTPGLTALYPTEFVRDSLLDASD